jgi:hypothetical protein
MATQLEHGKRLARGVLAEVYRLPAPHIRAIGQALRLAGGTAGRFDVAFGYAADVVEYDDVEGWLAELKLAGDIRDAVLYDPHCDELLERLEDVEVQPWIALRQALVAARSVMEHREVA